MEGGLLLPSRYHRRPRPDISDQGGMLDLTILLLQNIQPLGPRPAQVVSLKVFWGRPLEIQMPIRRRLGIGDMLWVMAWCIILLMILCLRVNCTSLIIVNDMTVAS